MGSRQPMTRCPWERQVLAIYYIIQVGILLLIGRYLFYISQYNYVLKSLSLYSVCLLKIANVKRCVTVCIRNLKIYNGWRMATSAAAADIYDVKRKRVSIL